LIYFLPSHCAELGICISFLFSLSLLFWPPTKQTAEFGQDSICDWLASLTCLALRWERFTSCGVLDSSSRRYCDRDWPAVCIVFKEVGGPRASQINHSQRELSTYDSSLHAAYFLSVIMVPVEKENRVILTQGPSEGNTRLGRLGQRSDKDVTIRLTFTDLGDLPH